MDFAQSSSRLTRSACARLALSRKERVDSGEPSARRHLRQEKGQAERFLNFLDSALSKRLAVEITNDHPVEEMAPGDIVRKKKPRFAANHTSINSTPRRSVRVQPDELNNSSPNEGPQTNSHGPQTKATGCQNQVTGSQNKSTDRQTQPTSPQPQSTGRQNQSTDRQTQPTSPRPQSTGRPNQSTNRQTQRTSPQPQSTGRRTPSVSPSDEAISPGTQSTDNTQDASNDETVAVSTIEKRKRGPTMGRGLMKALGGSSVKKLKVDVDPLIGRPKNRVQSAKFSSQVGVVARDVLPVPRKWKEVDVQSSLQPCIDHMQIYMDVNVDAPGVKQCLIDRVKSSSRQLRYRLHAHYKKYANVEEAKRNKPSSVGDKQHWESLCDYFDSPQFKNQSQANTNNRKKMRAKHVTGRTPFTVIQDEISVKNGKQCDRIELYRCTHQNTKGKWSSDYAEGNWEAMVANKEKYADEGSEKSEQEIATEVLGLANGYIKGLGYGPKPPGKSNQHLQQQLEQTRQELQESRSDNAAYKSKVDDLNHKLNEQAASIAELMAFMKASGHNASGSGSGNHGLGERDGESYSDYDSE